MFYARQIQIKIADKCIEIMGRFYFFKNIIACFLMHFTTDTIPHKKI